VSAPSQDKGATMSATHTDTPLKRVLGVRSIAAGSFNGIVGVGIFGLPALIANVLGPAAILAYLVCIVLIALVGLCLAEAGSRVSEAGGLYAYARAAYGPVVSGVAGILLLIANAAASSAALARLLVDTLAGVWPAAGGTTVGVAILAVLYATLAIVNIRGVREGAGAARLFAILKLVPLILLIVVGLSVVGVENLRWTTMPGASTIGHASVLLIFAFVGVETGLGTGGEARDPARTIPRAIGLALVTVAALYIGLQVVAQGVLGPALASSSTPLVAVAVAVFGAPAAGAMVTLTLVSGTGFLVADMLSSPRTAFTLAGAGQLPQALTKIHPRYATPSVAILAYSALAFLLAASGSFRQLVLLISSGTLLLYLIVCIGVLRLRAKRVAMAGEPFRVPGGAIVPLAAAALIVALLATLAWAEVAAALALVTVSGGVYAALDHRRRRA
jgi:amino acid transporter